MSMVTIEEYTSPNPITATEDTPYSDLLGMMKNNEIRHLPILRENKVVGIISDRDLKVLSVLSDIGKAQIRASDIMAKDPVSVLSTTSLDDAALEMAKAKIGSLIVYDEDDNLLGIFTLTDALNALVEMSREARKS